MSCKHNQINKELKLEVINYYGGNCLDCGEDHIEFLTIDHIMGNGGEHRKKFAGGLCGPNFYRWLRKNGYPLEYQVLCFGCNLKKGFLKRDKYIDYTLIEVKEGKICNKCGVKKPFTEYYIDNRRNQYYTHCRECYNDDVRQRSLELKIKIMYHYGEGKCECCGEGDIDILTIDHINGQGNSHRRSIGNNGGQHMYRWLRQNDFPEGFRVLCMNCNASLGMHGYCPHELEE